MDMFFFFVLGLIIGSFLNVVVCRLKEGETVLGRSVCRSCRHQIRWYDNIPLVSFLVLWGRCRDCRTSISWQYPLLELATAGGFVLVGRFFFDIADQRTWIETIWLLGIVSLFLAIAVYDLRYMEIPVVLLWVSVLWVSLFLAASLYQGGTLGVWSWEHPVTQQLMGGGVVGLFFFALVYASKETWMGWGDVWLGGIAGMVVGLHATLFMLTLSFGMGAFCGLLMMARGSAGLKSQIPFAPYLALGTLLTLFLPPMFPGLSRWFFF
jgi:prepilin signal peptidase PulO-like enzyme (type II secretory pathway)